MFERLKIERIYSSQDRLNFQGVLLAARLDANHIKYHIEYLIIILFFASFCIK